MMKPLAAASLCILAAGSYALLPGERILSPAETVEASVSALRQNDLKSLLSLSMSEEQIAIMRRSWDDQRRQGASQEEQAEFAQAVAFLTASGAEERIMQMIRPKLDEMRPQWSMTVAMTTGMLESMIEMNEEMDTHEKDQARRVFQAVAQILQKNDFTDEARARKAVNILCGAARELGVSSVDDVQALEFDQLLVKGGHVMSAVKRVLGVYGVDLDSWLESVEAETIYEAGDVAKVRVSFEILGSTQTVDADMVRVNERWVGKDSRSTADFMGF